MVKRESEMKREQRENMRGGAGNIDLIHLLNGEDMMGKCRLASKLTMPPGSSIGEHSHGPDAEIYMVISGIATVTDNGVTKTLKAGDVMFTGGGGTHSIVNDSENENLELYAIVIN